MVKPENEPAELQSPQPAALETRWALRDWIAGAALFAATAGVVLWQNAHVAVLFDLSYILNTAERIALGQVPYRDFPLAHAPLTFLLQAAIVRLTGRVIFHHVLYVAITGGLGTVLGWRIALGLLRGRVAAAWTVAWLASAPLIFLGVYSIVPNPEYDCDCGFWLLVALWFFLRVDSVSPANSTSIQNEPCHPERSGPRSRLAKSKDLRLLFVPVTCARWSAGGFAAGAALVIPIFFKQNMGLPLLLTAVGAVLLVLALERLQSEQTPASTPGPRPLLAYLAGVGAALLAAILAIHCTAGLGNYLHWTIQYAGQRRMPGVSLMLGVYSDWTLAWTLPCVAAALILLGAETGRRLWARMVAFSLLAAPFVFALASLLLLDDADERGDALLALWPLVLVLGAALALVNLLAAVRRGPRGQLFVRGMERRPALRLFLPLLLLAAIHGTFLSQQLWGSTYGIWPLLILLIADLLAFLAPFVARGNANRWFTPALAAVISIALLVCGGFYTASEERLSYANLPDGPAAHSTFPALAGLATPGPYLPEIDELLRYAQANIPFDDGMVVIPGEEPFYFATGRNPRFPVPFFDPTIDPYSPNEIADLVRARNIRWLIVKTDVQTKEDPTPDRAELMRLLMQEFTPAAHLRGYDVYRR
jgi:hypothetical protein